MIIKPAIYKISEMKQMTKALNAQVSDTTKAKSQTEAKYIKSFHTNSN